MGLTEEHWFEDENELNERQLERALEDEQRAYDRGYKQGQEDLKKQTELYLLQEFGARELTMDEWQKWKKDPKRDPICQVYYDDFTPFWILDPNEVNEVLYYAGKIKLFTKKPEKWQVNWK